MSDKVKLSQLEVLTAKGDLLSRNASTEIIIPVGTNGTQLVADTTQAVGQRWGLKHNLTATTNPGASNDSSEGYEPGSKWNRTDATEERYFVCVKATAGAAIWREVGNAIKLQGLEVVATAPGVGDYLKWNSDDSQWEPGAVSGVTPALHHTTHENGGSDEISVAGLSGVLADKQDAAKLQGRDVVATAPDVGDYLKWNSDDSQWEPGPVSGGGGSGPEPIFSDDYEFTEPGTTFVTKVTFRTVIDSNYSATDWLLIFELWRDGGVGTCECKISIGSDTYTFSSSNSAAGTIAKHELACAATENALLTATIELRCQGGATLAHMKYKEIKAIH